MQNFIDSAFDFVMGKMVMPVVVIVLALFVLLLPFVLYAAYKDAQSPTFSLRKDGWACTASHVVTTTIYVKSGDVMVPMSSDSNVCDQWSAARN